ncbi:unnamed protein product [Oikopleura dioica]|uniref:Amino acid permease/ SLC12A domain-containing protein n=1 Tax=Oikopleura dioica TaxID=34765 RepID=E4YAI7_OIKDI|nr:unnamed protein product [Oikopleura dioica]
MDRTRLSVSSKASSNGGVKLQRNLTVWGGIALVVGTMIGSGIFVSPTGILKESGSVGSSLIIWAVAGSIATLNALCYIELGLLIDGTGAEYTYCNDAYGSLIGFRHYVGRSLLWLNQLVWLLWSLLSLIILLRRFIQDAMHLKSSKNASLFVQSCLS